MIERSSRRTFTDLEVLEVLKEFKTRWEGADLPKLHLEAQAARISLFVQDKGEEVVEYINFIKYPQFPNKWALFWSGPLDAFIQVKMGLKLYMDNITRQT